MTYPDLSKITSLDQIPDGTRFNDASTIDICHFIKQGNRVLYSDFGEVSGSNIGQFLDGVRSGLYFPCDPDGMCIPWPPQEPDANAELAKLEGKYFSIKGNILMLSVKDKCAWIHINGKDGWEIHSNISEKKFLSLYKSSDYYECDASGNPIEVKADSELTKLEGKFFIKTAHDEWLYKIEHGLVSAKNVGQGGSDFLAWSAPQSMKFPQLIRDSKTLVECDSYGNPITAKVPDESLEGRRFKNLKNHVIYLVRGKYVVILYSDGKTDISGNYPTLESFRAAIDRRELIEVKEPPKEAPLLHAEAMPVEPEKHSQAEQDLRDRLLVAMTGDIWKEGSVHWESNLARAFEWIDAIMAERARRMK